MRCIALCCVAIVAACTKTEIAATPESHPSTQATSTSSAPPPVASAVTLGSIPASWVACSVDADCTFASLGCCDTTAVNRAHAADLQKYLEASGRPYCPPKDACGPSSDGTWKGAPGVCKGGVCGQPAP
jgi:hypothetical protein